MRRLPTELYPFKGRFLEVGGHRLHYLDEGQGRPVVMLHGNPTWSFMYRDLVRVLAPGCRCIVPDHLGMGLSDKPRDYDYHLGAHLANLQALVEHLGLGEIALVVHAWGGAIGMAWAVRHAERVRRLVIMNTAAFSGGRIPRRIAVCRLPLLGPLAVRGLNAFARAATFMTTTGSLSAVVKAGYLAPYGSWAARVGILRFVQDIPLGPADRSWPLLLETEQGLGRLRGKPVLLQWGERDWCFTPWFRRRWQEFFPGARVDAYADAGHYLLEDRGPEIIARVREFLASDARGED